MLSSQKFTPLASLLATIAASRSHLVITDVTPANCTSTWHMPAIDAHYARPMSKGDMHSIAGAR